MEYIQIATRPTLSFVKSTTQLLIDANQSNAPAILIVSLATATKEKKFARMNKGQSMSAIKHHMYAWKKTQT